MTATRLGVAEASALILANARALDAEPVSLELALGRVLAADIVSPVALPPWDNSSMDGYAVRGDDVRGASRASPATLAVTGTVAAGQRPSRVVGAGEAMRIMTGAPVPEGADTVVRVEDTDGGTERVLVHDDRDLSRNIRQRGEDVRAGATVMRAGTVLGAAQVGVLASVGCSSPRVHRRPRVAVLATGDELVTVDRFDEVLRGDRIVSSNSYSLAAAVREAGGEPVLLGIAADDPDEISHGLERARDCDLILTSGGVSVGEFDFTRTVVERLGGELAMWRVRMRPGAPIGFGTLFGRPWIGLPGNPVSALVTFELFARPLIRVLGGHRRPHRRVVEVIAGEDIRLAAPLTHFLRVVLDRDEGEPPRARLTGSQSSGMLTSMAQADALLVVPPEPQAVPAGTRLRAIPLGDSADHAAHFPA
ncbi:MAG TPA: gephyrin-like molybdotransferase Glp [Gemmatimonadaceae bacterium]|nr:gephyrin-like molybdotransferase Glp [Gemmatimonadaceae bacterium]